MLKREFFIKGLKAGACKKRAWVMACFNYVVKDAPRHSSPDYPYRLFKYEDRLYFIDPELTESKYQFEGYPDNLNIIDDYIPGEPLFEWLEPFTLQPGELDNYLGTTPLETTPGNVYVNHLLFCIPFGDKIEFINGYIDMGKVGNQILELLVDDPTDDTGEPSPPGQIYCRELIQHNEYALSLVAWCEDNVIPITPKSITGHPDREKVKAQEMAKYKGRLNDPAVIAAIGKRLQELDNEYLQGDAAGNYYASKKKKFTSSRIKQFYMFGGESPFEDGTHVTFMDKSLEEGIDTDPKKLTVMFNSQRAGSYNRGFQTRLGGEKTKTVYRMLGTTRVEGEDCGDTVGIPVVIKPKYGHRYYGFYYLDKGKPVRITEDNIDTIKGKQVWLRDPMACKQDINRTETTPGKGKNICAICAGDNLAEMPEGIPAAAAGTTGRFLTLFLKSMHASGLSTKKWTINEGIT